MFSSRILSLAIASAMLLVGQAQAAALIATDPVSACGPPNNGGHHLGSSCKYYSGPSSNSPIVSGTCVTQKGQNGRLTCVRG